MGCPLSQLSRFMKKVVDSLCGVRNNSYHCEIFRNEKNRNMENPFKFGTIVDGKFFTDRAQELQYVQQVLRSENHLVLMSPRRFGKSSLVNKALEQTDRKHIIINMQSVTSVQNFAVRLMSALFRLYPGEKMKHLMTHFRVAPAISTNPMNRAGCVAVA